MRQKTKRRIRERNQKSLTITIYFQKQWKLKISLTWGKDLKVLTKGKISYRGIGKPTPSVEKIAIRLLHSFKRGNKKVYINLNGRHFPKIGGNTFSWKWTNPLWSSKWIEATCIVSFSWGARSGWMVWTNKRTFSRRTHFQTARASFCKSVAANEGQLTQLNGRQQ